MSLILNEYKDGYDLCFYDSSNVLASICDDKVDSLKDVKVIFSDSRCYEYKGVNVNDYLLFRSNVSQGKALYKYLAVKVKGENKHETTRLENYDLNKLNSEKKRIVEEREMKAKLILEQQMKEKEIEKSLSNISSVDIDPEFNDLVNENFNKLI